MTEVTKDWFTWGYAASHANNNASMHTSRIPVPKTWLLDIIVTPAFIYGAAIGTPHLDT